MAAGKACAARPFLCLFLRLVFLNFLFLLIVVLVIFRIINVLTLIAGCLANVAGPREFLGLLA